MVYIRDILKEDNSERDIFPNNAKAPFPHSMTFPMMIFQTFDKTEQKKRNGIPLPPRRQPNLALENAT